MIGAPNVTGLSTGNVRAMHGQLTGLLLLFFIVGVCDELWQLGLCYVLGVHAVLLLLVLMLLFCR